jgi:hypothetical protein
MKNLLEQVKNFVNNEINIKSEIAGDFVQGYHIAMIDVRDFITFRENEYKLIGKWGYFWNEEDSGNCTYGYLVNIEDEFYICKSRISENIKFDNFLTTPPLHLK